MIDTKKNQTKSPFVYFFDFDKTFDVRNGDSRFLQRLVIYLPIKKKRKAKKYANKLGEFSFVLLFSEKTPFSGNKTLEQIQRHIMKNLLNQIYDYKIIPHQVLFQEVIIKRIKIAHSAHNKYFHSSSKNNYHDTRVQSISQVLSI